MRRFALMCLLCAALAACGGNPPPPTQTPTPIPTPTLIVEGEGLPLGTLILSQLNQQIAQRPDGRQIRLGEDRYGAQASPNGRYGVKFVSNGATFDLVVTDYEATPPNARPVPEGANYLAPGVTWAADSSGFAFFDFPAALGNVAPASARTLRYFDVAAGQTRTLITEAAQNRVVAAIAFSPDGRYLLYTVSDAQAEGVGGPGAAAFVLNMTTGSSFPLTGVSLLGFAGWLRDSSGFLTLRIDPKTGNNGVVLYRLNALAQPARLTPSEVADFLVSTSPDGRRLIVSSSVEGIPALFMMNTDGTGRRQIATFNTPNTVITGLVWGNDGLYYSLAGTGNLDTVWRADLDGKNAAQIGIGTLLAVIGAR